MPHLSDPHARPDDPADDDDGWNEGRDELVYLKYEFEGVKSLGALSSVSRDLATRFDDLSAAGWRLNSPVDTGYAHLVKDAD